MAQNIQIRSNWQNLLEPILAAYFNDGVERYQPRYTEIFKQYSSDKAVETFLTTAGLGLFNEKGEGDTTELETLGERYKTQIENVAFAKKIRITKEMMDDEQYPVMEQKSTQLGRMAEISKDVAASAILNGAFTTVGSDGKALCATDHPLTGGGTQSNKITSVLSATSLNDALLALRAMTNEQGVLLGYSANTLVVPPALAKLAEEIVNSPLSSGTDHNDKNVYLGSLKIIVWDMLSTVQGGSDTAWFVMDSMADNGLVFVNRESTSTNSWMDEDTDDLFFKARYRIGTGFIDYKNIIGSDGTV